ncbi:MAG: MbnP family protein [Dokdonia sp.]|jgi:hypothetical protein
MKAFDYLSIIAISIGLLSCDNDETTSKNPGTLELNLMHTVGADILDLGEAYQNTSGETYVVEELKYIISNIRLTNIEGDAFIYPVDESYFVIDQAMPSTQMIRLSNIDAGAYTQLTFGFGVDPTKYPIASGTLNFVPTAEEADMLWTWSAGYKFIKFEGSFTSDTTPTPTPFVIHVGSHGATLDNYKEIELSLISDTGDPLIIEEDAPAVEGIFFDVGRVFDGPNTISIEAKTDIQVDPVNAPKIANNIQTAVFIPRG